MYLDPFTFLTSDTPKTKKDSKSPSKTKIVTDFDKVWDYKKEGDKYYAKKKGTTNWILSTGKSEESIRIKVFKDVKNEPLDKDLPTPQELEIMYKKDLNNIINNNKWIIINIYSRPVCICV